MKKNDCKDFFEAIGLEEETMKKMLMQICIGVVIGIFVLSIIGIGNCIGDYLSNV